MQERHSCTEKRVAIPAEALFRGADPALHEIVLKLVHLQFLPDGTFSQKNPITVNIKSMKKTQWNLSNFSQRNVEMKKMATRLKKHLPGVDVSVL